jgi:hypothetical protein
VKGFKPRSGRNLSFGTLQAGELRGHERNLTVHRLRDERPEPAVHRRELIVDLRGHELGKV